MAKVSNEVQLIIALWKERLDRRRDVLAEEEKTEKASANTVETYYAVRELDGIALAENRLLEIISDLEEGKL